MDTFTKMTNLCVDVGLASNVTSLKSLSLLCYNRLSPYDSPAYYKYCAISRAIGMVASYRKSINRGFDPNSPFSTKPMLVAYMGFIIKNDVLEIPVARGQRFAIRLTKHTVRVISRPGIKVRSFTLTPETLSICIARDVPQIECNSTLGVDRNLRNLTLGNDEHSQRYDLSETVRITKTTNRIVSCFRRNDARLRRALASKYGRRRRHRVDNRIHNATTSIVDFAMKSKEALVIEDIRNIRALYRKGNCQGRSYRGLMNSWSFGKAQHQIEYKANWVGLPVIRLTRGETMGTSMLCPRCGERLQSDTRLKRKVWCGKCRWLMDRDIAAAINIAQRGRLRFDRSQPTSRAQGLPVEAMVEEPEPTRDTVILKVDGGKPN